MCASFRLPAFFFALFLSAIALASPSQTALLEAIRTGHVQRVAILLDMGVSPEATTQTGQYQGKSALMWAASGGQTEIIGLLLEYGAAIDRTNRKDGTALMYAAVEGHVDAIEQLIKAGADPNHTVRLGWTPLMLATTKGHVDAVRTLIKLGADPTRRDSYNWTLLMRAAERDDLAMAQALLDVGLRPDADDGAGNSALTIASKHGNRQLLELLQERAGTGAS